MIIIKYYTQGHVDALGTNGLGHIQFQIGLFLVILYYEKSLSIVFEIPW